MRTPEDIAFPYNRIIYERQTGDEVTISAAIDVLDVYDIIREAQTEAWNEAIETAAENAETKEICDQYGEWLMDDVDKDSILKLKK